MSEIMTAWSKLTAKTQPSEVDDARNQIIWLNSHIKVNSQVVIYKEYVAAGILRLGDLVNDNDAIYSLVDFKHKTTLYCTLGPLSPSFSASYWPTAP